MPYRWLPDDFRERYRSVWVDIPSELWDPEKGHYLYNEYLDELEFADKMGFDGICVNEHHANAYGFAQHHGSVSRATNFPRQSGRSGQ